MLSRTAVLSWEIQFLHIWLVGLGHPTFCCNSLAVNQLQYTPVLGFPAQVQQNCFLKFALFFFKQYTVQTCLCNPVSFFWSIFFPCIVRQHCYLKVALWPLLFPAAAGMLLISFRQVETPGCCSKTNSSSSPSTAGFIII